LTLGIETTSLSGPSASYLHIPGGIFAKIISRIANIPIIKSRIPSTAVDNQDRVERKVWSQSVDSRATSNDYQVVYGHLPHPCERLNCLTDYQVTYGHLPNPCDYLNCPTDGERERDLYFSMVTSTHYGTKTPPGQQPTNLCPGDMT